MQGRISLFVNDKGDNDKRPDFRGVIEIEGVDIKYKCSLWWRTAKNSGGKYLSGPIAEDDKQRDGEVQKPRYGGAPAPAQRQHPKQVPARPIADIPPSGKTLEQLQNMEVKVEDVEESDIPF
jgi:hypothetical protein